MARKILSAFQCSRGKLCCDGAFLFEFLSLGDASEFANDAGIDPAHHCRALPIADTMQPKTTISGMTAFLKIPLPLDENALDRYLRRREANRGAQRCRSLLMR